jgi:hypothetical protein
MSKREDERERKEWKKERKRGVIKRGELVEERNRKEGNAHAICLAW